MKKILLMGLMLFGIMPVRAVAENFPPEIKNITALTESFGVGQKLTTAIIEYDKNIDGSKIEMDSYNVTNRTITRVYANDKAEKINLNENEKNGKYVVIELNLDDEKALLFIKANNILPTEITLSQVREFLL